MTEADRAVANAMVIEAKKNSLGQAQSGDWKISFTVASGEVPTALLNAAMGQRFLLTLVELDDDEEAKEQPAGATEPPKERRRSRAQRAAILCKEEMFQRFISLEYARTANDTARNRTDPYADAKDHVADVVRVICGVDSRASLNTNEDAGKRWDALLGQYLAWANPQIGAA